MFQLSIVTPERVTYEGEIRSLMAPGNEGYLGILTGHAPLITALKPGKIEFRDVEDKIHLLAVSNGFLEVSGNKATILADAVEYSETIDIDRARSAVKRLQEQMNLAQKGEGGADMIEAKAGLERAINRIKIYEESH